LRWGEESLPRPKAKSPIDLNQTRREATRYDGDGIGNR